MQYLDREGHDVWIDPNPFCAIQYMKNELYSLADGSLELDWMQMVQKNIMEFCQVRSQNGRMIFSLTLFSESEHLSSLICGRAVLWLG